MQKDLNNNYYYDFHTDTQKELLIQELQAQLALHFNLTEQCKENILKTVIERFEKIHIKYYGV
jgi:hypothetical protein